MTERLAAIRRDYLPADLEREQAKVNLHGSIVVQARQSLKESRWLLELADEVKTLIEERQIEMGHARALLGLEIGTIVPEVVLETAGVVLKYRDDISRLSTLDLDALLQGRVVEG